MPGPTPPDRVRGARLAAAASSLFGVVAAAATAPAFAQTVERGEELVAYYHCERMVDDNTKAVTQIVRVVTHLEITVLQDGRRSQDSPLGRYSSELESRFKARGALRCEQRSQPDYTAPPGTSFEAWGPRMISVVSEPVDPSLFVIPQLKGRVQVFSLDGTAIGEGAGSFPSAQPAAAPRAAPAIIVESAPPPKTDAERNAERAERLDTAVRSTMETARNDPSWQEARKRRREMNPPGPASSQ